MTAVHHTTRSVSRPAVRGFTTTAVHAGQEPDPLTGVIDCWGVGALRDKQARDAAAAGRGSASAVNSVSMCRAPSATACIAARRRSSLGQGVSSASFDRP